MSPTPMRLFFAFASALAFPSLLSAFDVSYTINTVAGSDWVGDNGPSAKAILVQAEGIAADFSGNLYIADAANHRVRQVSPSGSIRTFAGTGMAGFSGDAGPASAAQLNSPYGLAFDTRGNLYIADLGNARVRRVAADGTISTIAGGGAFPAGGVNEGSLATSVSLAAPRNIALDGNGNMYISDFTAHCVYRLATDGSLITAAGTGTPGFSGDGYAAASAQLNFPTALAVNRQGALYIADSQNHLIRKVSGGVISSVARASLPTGLAFDGMGALYVADRGAGQILVLPAPSQANVQATAMNVTSHDLTFSVDGYLYAADSTVVRRIASSTNAMIVAGGGSLAEGDGAAAILSRLNHPSGVAADTLGNLYIADHDNNRIRCVTPDGTISTIAGTGDAGNGGDGGAARLATLNSPSAVTVDATGNLYIADTGNHRVRMITPSGIMVPVNTGRLAAPVCALPDKTGTLYIADAGVGSILKVSATGTSTTLFGGVQNPRGLALDSAGNLYFTETGAKRLWRLAPDGDHTSLAQGVWSAPQGIAVNAAGDIFVADGGLGRVLHLNPAGQVTPVAGTGSSGFAGDSGAALAAELSAPSDVAVGPAGTLYVADAGNNRIRSLTPGAEILVAPILVVDAVNAASLQPGPLAPGMLLALRGTGLTAADISQTQVLFDAISAPVLSIDLSRLLVRVPAAVAGLDTIQITIQRSGSSLARISAAVAAAAPALFADSTGQAAATNEDGTLNSSSNPAPRGSVIALYGTGEGVSGAPISVMIGGYPADILYAGPATYSGLFQVNARVPSGYIVPGVLSVVVTVGQASSQPGVAIVVN